MTNNGQDYTNNSLTYLYQQDIVLQHLINDHGPTFGGTPIFVTGTGFVNTTSLKCRIGHHVVSAHFLSKESILCFTPPQNIIEPAHDLNHALLKDLEMPHTPEYLIRPHSASPSIAYVEVANNGADFTNFRHFFSYSDAQFGDYQPVAEFSASLNCPRGTYCQNGSQTNFTLCPKGTYQPLRAQQSCLRCPIGYMCPEEGLPVPRVCPPGFICDVTGTEQANKPCPAGHYCLEATATSATTCSKRPSDEITFVMTNNDFFGAGRNSACWDNSTDDFGLQASTIPSRFWSERHLLPLDYESSSSPLRGRFCLDDSCLSLGVNDGLSIVDSSFDYSSTGFALWRPIPCPVGMYCAAGTSVNKTKTHIFTTPQPCFESMYCPRGSDEPNGIGECPRGFYCPFAEKIPCPIGTFCPSSGHWDPFPCDPGYFNFMVGQFECTKCPVGYICPGYGRIDPRICPPGYVCSKDGLVSPNIRCPAGFYCVNGTQTSDPFRNDTSLRPYPCAPGTYCLSGVGNDTVKLGDFLHAQPCSAGFFCEAASTTAKGSGLCPPGFTCPVGTANPIPTPKGHFAEFAGTVQAAACLPGFYAPTIQTTQCYPCPPGTSCEVEGLYEAEICPPGTYRSTLEDDGKSCVSCPQGSWSKNWQLRDKGECIKCPTGVNCQVDGMTLPCSLRDLPQPFVPVVNLDGLPIPEYKFPSSEMPPYFSLDECLKMNPTSNNQINAHNQDFFFGELIPPYIDILGRGAHFRSSDQGALKYSRTAKCFHNPSRYGTPLYRRTA